MTAALDIDRGQIASFADALLRYANDGVHISMRAFLEGQPRPLRIMAAKVNGAGVEGILPTAYAVATLAAVTPDPSVFCPPIAGFASATQARQADLTEAYALSVECDAGAAEARTVLEGLLGPATVVVASGGDWSDPATGELEPKLHLHWRLSEPAQGEALAGLKEARRAATLIVGGDPSNIPMVHPIRWPGSVHRKGPPRLAQIVSLNEGAELDLAEAAELLAERAKAAGSTKDRSLGQADRPRQDSADAEYESLVANVLRGENLHASLDRLAAKMVASGMFPGAVVMALRGMMQASLAPKDARWQARFDDIWRDVATAEAKFRPQQKEQPRQAEQPQQGQSPIGPTLDPWERFIAPPFPLETLPQVLQRFVRHTAASIGCDPAAVAMSALTVCSAALDQRFTLKMKRTGAWRVQPRLWTVLIGAPSTKKSPLMVACTRPLKDHEAIGVREYQRTLAAWKADKTEGAASSTAPAKPTRYILDDTTTEAVGDILSRQDRGALSFRDELAGWIGSMEKYSGGKGSAADRSFWLQAYNGGPKTFDRITRGEIFIENLCVAFLGGIQPERLNELGKLTSDGLLQRFLPVVMKPATLAQEDADDGAAAEYADLVHRLIGLHPHGLAMDEGARTAAAEFQGVLFDLEQMDGLGLHFCSFIGKLAGIHGSLSLVLHLAEDPREAGYSPVPERVVRAAERIVREFIIPHALELYRSTQDAGDWEDLRTIASFVLTGTKDRLTPSDFTSGVWSLRGIGLWNLGQKLSPLVAGGWLSEDVIGGAIKSWSVTPGLRQALADRRSQEAERKRAVLQTLRSLRQEAEDA